MLAEVPESTEKVWLGSDDEDLKRLLRDLQQVDLPEQPLKAWGRLQLLHRIKNCINAIELDHIKVLKRIEKGDPYGVANAADWLAQSMHMRPNAAYAKVCTACELEEFPALDQAVHAGEVSPEATIVILQSLRRVRRHLSDEDVVGVESEMLLAAREMDHAQLRAHGSKLFHLLDRQAHSTGRRCCGTSGSDASSTSPRGPRETELAEFRGVEAPRRRLVHLQRRAGPGGWHLPPDRAPCDRRRGQVHPALGRRPYSRPGPCRRAGGAGGAPLGVRRPA